jgi:uncharacterized RDD family membrane protein YckC
MENSTAAQCASCLAVYDGSVTDSHDCRSVDADAGSQTAPSAEDQAMNTSTCKEPQTPPSLAAGAEPTQASAREQAGGSTLIAFPRAGRANRPQWRKDLSERVREIQQRRALEAAREAEGAAPAANPHATSGTQAAAAGTIPAGASLGTDSADNVVADAGPSPSHAASTQLGLVPAPETPDINPIVARALEKIERAHRQVIAQRQGARAAAAPAAARVTEEVAAPPAPTTRPAPPEAEPTRAAEAQAPAAATETKAEPERVERASEPERATMPERAATNERAAATERTAATERASTLIVVPPPLVSGTEEAIKEALKRPRPRRHLSEIADDALLLRREADILPPAADPAESLAVRAPVLKRLTAGLVDLFVVAFSSSPFAAVIELTSGNWHDPRVAACLGGIVLTVMFLYLTVSVALAGRTWGMSLVSLRAVDARNGLAPTPWQCARRALLYMLSLATLGLGLLPALFDREGRAAHDRLSRTVVVVD